jgi:ribosome biogenesis GTPase
MHQSQGHDSLPKVGDWVAVQKVAGEDKVIIEAVLPRRTCLERKSTGKAAESQVLASNMDLVFVVQALDISFNQRRLERICAVAGESGAVVAVVLNKCDLCKKLERTVKEVAAFAGEANVVASSAKTGKGLGEIRKMLAGGKTAVFLGSSGVGKSSLINRLYGEAVQHTIVIRGEDGKGRHTTTSRELILLPTGGLVIDTPGLREFQLWSGSDTLDDTFADVAETAVGCRFGNCRHQAEPGCAVRTAVEQGKLDAKRAANFIKLKAEAGAIHKLRRERGAPSVRIKTPRARNDDDFEE